MKKENNKKKSEENQWIWGIVLILMILGVLWFFGLFDGNEDYEDMKFCAESCASDIDYCVFSSITYDQSRNAWIPYDDYEICSLDLESCIDDCSAS